jgi:single-stranded DNA-binding protein
MLINNRYGIWVTGRVTKDPETKQTTSSSVTKFSVLYGQGAEADESGRKPGLFMDVDVWGKDGEEIASCIRKGDHLGIAGQLKKREYEGKTYYSVNAQEIFLTAGVTLSLIPEPDEAGCNSAEISHAKSAPVFEPLDEDDGNLPF